MRASSPLRRCPVLIHVGLICYFILMRNTCVGKNLMRLGYSLSLQLLGLHVQIPLDKPAYSVTMGCPVSKTLWGQTDQVSLSQSDKVFYPQTCLTSLKTHSGPQGRLMFFPHTAGLCWFTALVRSPHKHMSSSSPLRELFSRRCNEYIYNLHASQSHETSRWWWSSFIFITTTDLKYLS